MIDNPTIVLKRTEEEDTTEVDIVNEEKKDKETKISSTQDTNSHPSSNILDVAALTEKMVEVSNKAINDNREKFLDINNQLQKQIEDKDSKIEESQLSSYIANIKTAVYKTKEEINNRFTNNVIDFVTLDAKYKEEVVNYEYAIRGINENLKPHEDLLNQIEIELRILDSEYEKLNNTFYKLIHVLEKLKFEYKSSMNEDKYIEKKESEERILKQLLDEISHKELELLYKEREKLNKNAEMSEEISILEKFKDELNQLKNEQTRVNSIEIMKLASFQTENLIHNKSDKDEVIDTVVYYESEKK